MSIYFTNQIQKIHLQTCQSDKTLGGFKKSDVELTETEIVTEKINKQVSIIYYPYQNSPIPHSKLEIEGDCYSYFWCMSENTKLSRLIKNSQTNNWRVKPFVRIDISVTPEQFKELKDHLHGSSFSINCMRGVSNLLSSHADFVIPFPISYSPTLSTGYLCARKALGHSRITSISCYPPLSSYSISFGDIYKLGYACASISVEFFLLYNIPKLILNNSQLVRAISDSIR